MLEYGLHTLLNRAVLDFRDGLKPAQRRLIWTGYTMGLWPEKGYKKAAKIVGDCMGNLHPVGDIAIYQALVGLVNSPVAPFTGSGNWGMPAIGVSEAAPRYTECRLSAMGRDLLLDPYYLNVTEMVPNYDASQLEPVVLPARLPLALLNGATGIAVGATSRVPMFDVDGIKKLIALALSRDSLEVTPKDCAKYLKVVCQYGGVLKSSAADLKPLWETGSCKLLWECAYTVDAKAKAISITGIPPDWTFETKLDALRKDPSVRQVIDLTAGKGINAKIVIKASTTAEFDKLSKALIAKHLKSTFTTVTNFVSGEKTVNESGFVERSAKFIPSISIAKFMTQWIAWRVDLEKKAAKYCIDELLLKISREEALKKAAQKLDEVIKIVRSKTIKNKIQALMKLLSITEENAKVVWETSLGRFDRLSEDAQVKKIKDLNAALKDAKVKFKAPAAAALVDLKRFDKPKGKKAK